LNELRTKTLPGEEAMKGLIVILIFCLPSTLIAQETLFTGITQKSGMDSAVSENSSLISLTSSASGPASSASAPQPPPLPPQASKSTQEKTKEPSQPPVEGSMVGYIDNAIIGSQIRIRFDAAFNDQFPDRAEFFYAKCSCYRNLGLDPNPPGPGTGIPKSVNFQQLYFDGEYAPIRRFSLFAEIPIRWLQPQGFVTSPVTTQNNFAPFPNESGLGDVMAGFKLAPWASANNFLTFQFRAYFPSGDASRGLGTHHYSIEPGVLYYQRLSERLGFEGQLRYLHAIGGSIPPPFTFAAPTQVNGVPVPNGVKTTSSDRFAGNIFIYGIGPSYRLYDGEHFRFTPVVEFFGWRVLSGFETGAVVNGVLQPGFADASGTNIVNIKIGARFSFETRSSFYVGYGRALTSADWYDQIVRLEYRYSF
jgi:hypothetical protein